MCHCTWWVRIHVFVVDCGDSAAKNVLTCFYCVPHSAKIVRQEWQVRYIVSTIVVDNFRNWFWHVVPSSSCRGLGNIFAKGLSFYPAIEVVNWRGLWDISNWGCSLLRFGWLSSFCRFLGSRLGPSTSVPTCWWWSFGWCSWSWYNCGRSSSRSSDRRKSSLFSKWIVLPILALCNLLGIKSLHCCSERNCRLFEISDLILSNVSYILLVGLFSHHLFFVNFLASFIFKSVGIPLLLFFNQTLNPLLFFNPTLKLSF